MLNHNSPKMKRDPYPELCPFCDHKVEQHSHLTMADVLGEDDDMTDMVAESPCQVHCDIKNCWCISELDGADDPMWAYMTDAEIALKRHQVQEINRVGPDTYWRNSRQT